MIAGFADSDLDIDLAVWAARRALQLELLDGSLTEVDIP